MLDSELIGGKARPVNRRYRGSARVECNIRRHYPLLLPAMASYDRNRLFMTRQDRRIARHRPQGHCPPARHAILQRGASWTRIPAWQDFMILFEQG